MTGLLDALALDVPESLETRRLVLRAARAGLGATVNEALVESHAELRPWMPWAKTLQSAEQTEAFCREGETKWRAREMFDFCLFRGEDGRLVGKGGLHTIDWTVPKFEIGYWIRSSCTGRGYASEAVAALAAFARSSLGARRLEITSDARNAASRRVAERAGFVLEGILRNRRRDAEGLLADTCLYARVFPDG